MCCGCQPCDSPRVLPPQNAFKHYMRTRDYCTTGRHVIHMCLQGGWLHGCAWVLSQFFLGVCMAATAPLGSNMLSTLVVLHCQYCTVPGSCA